MIGAETRGRAPPPLGDKAAARSSHALMIGSMEDDHQWYDAARIEEVAAVTSGGLTISRAAWNQTASRQRCPFLLPEMKLSALGNLETLVAKSGLAQNWSMSLQVGQSRAARIHGFFACVNSERRGAGGLGGAAL